MPLMANQPVGLQDSQRISNRTTGNLITVGNQFLAKCSTALRLAGQDRLPYQIRDLFANGAASR